MKKPQSMGEYLALSDSEKLRLVAPPIFDGAVSRHAANEPTNETTTDADKLRARFLAAIREPWHLAINAGDDLHEAMYTGCLIGYEMAVDEMRQRLKTDINKEEKRC